MNESTNTAICSDLLKLIDQQNNCICVAGVLRTRKDRAAFASPFSSLKVKTQKCILLHKKFFCDLATLQPDTNPFSKISKSMRKELIELEALMQTEAEDQDEIYEDQVEQQCQVLKLLLNDKVTSFHFPSGLDLSKQTAASALWRRLVAERPPDLQTIVFRCRPDSYTPGWVIRPFFSNMVTLFPQLQVLQLDTFTCHNSHLTKIADNFPQLRVLEVLLCAEVNREGILSLCKLSSLQEFIFMASLDLDPTKLVMCLELLPQLHVVGGRSEQFCDRYVQLGILMAQSMSALAEHPRTLQLRQMVLSLFVLIPDTVSLPELRVLFVLEPRVLALDARRFTKLSELNVFGTNLDDLMSIVGQVGRRLLALRFSVAAVVQLDVVLDACPNLSELDMHTSGLQSASQLRPETLGRLRTLIYSVQGPHLDGPDSVQAGLMMLMLRLAPKLRKVHLTLFRLDVEDMKELARLAKQQICMRRLEEITIRLDPVGTSVMHAHLLELALCSLAIHCPRLHTVISSI